MPKAKAAARPARDGEKKGPSPYNQFMSKELPKIKSKHPELNHKEVFKMAAGLWATHTDNPKNKAK